MWNSVLADVVVALHLGYVSFVLAGLLLIVLGGLLRWGWVRNLWFRAIHLAMMLVVAIEAVFGITCPMTEWEQQLSDAVEERSFIGRLLSDILFYDLPDDDPIFMWAYVGVAALILATFIFVPPRIDGYRVSTVVAIVLGLVGAIFVLFIEPRYLGLGIGGAGLLCWALGKRAATKMLASPIVVTSTDGPRDSTSVE